MSFLPVAQRELRVAARRKSTMLVRTGAALLGLAIGMIWLVILQFGTAAGMVGGLMFTVLSWYTLLTCLLAGVFLASDSLSEERREGTLGFLFLTDLKGYDIVIGKFLAVSLNAFYGLLAVFPILALCMLVGGVSWPEFARRCLSLANILFFSVASALWISGFCKTAYRSMSAAICLLIILLTAGIVAEETSLSRLAALSPFGAFLYAPEAQYFRLAKTYWNSLGISHLAGWLLLGWASWHLRSFRDDAKPRRKWMRFFAWNIAGRAKRRTRLLETNPILWLLDDSRRMQWMAWALSLCGVTILVLMRIYDNQGRVLMMSGYALWPFYFLLKIFFAILACRFFTEARRTGALELLCCTPLTMRTILRGQWSILRSVYFWPVAVLLGAHLIVELSFSSFSGFSPLVVFGIPTGLTQLYFFSRTIADFFALGWFGMWLSLSLKKPSMATGLTILYVLILPMFAICVPTLIADAIFISIGAAKLTEDFRLRQAQWLTPNQVAKLG